MSYDKKDNADETHETDEKADRPPGTEGAMSLDIDPSSSVPIYQQVVDGIRRLIAIGALRPGDRVPTVRDLAVQLRVNRNTAARAIQDLEARGVVRTRVGQGTFVADGVDDHEDTSREALLAAAFDALAAEAERLQVPPRELPERLRRHLARMRPPRRPPSPPQETRR